MNKTKISAEIVADSLDSRGNRLTSLLITFPRIILAEINTHRMLSKNTSSSRAIPFKKMVEAVQNDPFIPIAWQKEHTGMQGYEYIIDEELINECRLNWLGAKDKVIQFAKDANYNLQVTKQLCNRLLEPFMWTTMLITGSKEGWDNFFNLRCPVYYYAGNDKSYKSKKELLPILLNDFGKSPADSFWYNINKGQAEIHMMDLAEKIYDAVNESTPRQLHSGQWHIPFEDKICDFNITLSNEELVKISTAMAAHTSYTTVGNESVKSYEKWIELHDRLLSQDPPHSSPLEHCARAMSNEEYYEFFKGRVKDPEFYNGNGWCFNLKGFISYRYMIDNNYK